MNGHTISSEVQSIDHVLWPDAEIEGISVGYERIDIALTESTGNRKQITCWGHVGVRMLGFWDEVVVEDAAVLTDDPFIDACVVSLTSRFAKGLPETGCPDRNAKTWTLLRITLSDAATIDVVATRFSARDLPRVSDPV